MALKKRYSVRWRLMLPVVVCMFIVVTLIIAFQYKSEMKLREENYCHSK